MSLFQIPAVSDTPTPRTDRPHGAEARHFLNLSLTSNGVKMLVECRHDPLPAEGGRVCAGYIAESEYGMDFLDWHANAEGTELRCGLIDAWWDIPDSDGDADLMWEYVPAA